MEAPVGSLVDSQYADQLGNGCRILQEAYHNKVREMEAELARQRRANEEARRHSEAVRERNAQLEAEMGESRQRWNAIAEDNRSLAQQVVSLRGQVAKLGKFRDDIAKVFNSHDLDHSGNLDKAEFAAARQELGLRANFAQADANHDGAISRAEFNRLA
eukprot:gnl/TRDRNA2_/TRDRNA2_185798_c0_seq1.p1 gnl/TRDRNA2_/TRDRNA2_185798_c0~~gnl/TRDRNA2_/TRDRNA2_185798_c0_seq1.p1  ORF type:complete len:159 (+),score=32.52 gnl/TRDRNA2_/TRDRNA2_185798_c0_seq1:101-577(+)